MSINLRNFGVIEGRLTRDPKMFDNEDGSKKVMITVAVPNNFTSASGERESQFVGLEGFIPAPTESRPQTMGPYPYMHVGDLVGVQYSVRSYNYTDDSGNTVYRQILHIEAVDLKETKKAAEARRAAKGESAEIDTDATEDGALF